MNIMSSTGRVSCPTLTGLNFQRWKFQMTNILEAEGVLDIVMGVELKPALPLITASEYGVALEDQIKWKKQDARARAIISCSLDDINDGYIRGCKNSHEIWQVIIGIHEKKTVASKSKACQDFFSYVWHENVSSATALSEMNGLSRKSRLWIRNQKSTLSLEKFYHHCRTNFDHSKLRGT